MAAPAHYLADEAKRLAIAEARELIEPLKAQIKELSARLDRLEHNLSPHVQAGYEERI